MSAGSGVIGALELKAASVQKSESTNAARSFSGSNSAHFTLCPFPLLLLLLLPPLPPSSSSFPVKKYLLKEGGHGSRAYDENTGSLIKLLFNCAKVEQLGGTGWDQNQNWRDGWRNPWDLHVCEWRIKQDSKCTWGEPQLFQENSETACEPLRLRARGARWALWWWYFLCKPNKGEEGQVGSKEHFHYMTESQRCCKDYSRGYYIVHCMLFVLV